MPITSFAALLDTSETVAPQWKPGDVRSKDLVVTVEEVSSAAIRLRLHGSVRLANDADAAIAETTRALVAKRDLRPSPNADPQAFPRYQGWMLGYLNYDRERKRFNRFDIVALGEYDGLAMDPYRAEEPKKSYYYVTRPYPLGVAFEMAPRDGVVPPSGCR